MLARVVAVGASPHSHTLRIERGSDDGVVRGAPVIAPEGVVGIVSQLTGSYADVQLIVSPLSAVPAVSQRTRSRSTVKGTGDIARCKLTYALHRRPAGVGRPGHRGRPGVLSPRAPHRPGGQRGEEASRTLPRR